MESFFKNLLEHIREVKLPDLPPTEEILSTITGMNFLLGTVLCLLGLAYLMVGLKRYRLFMMFNGAILGTFAGGIICVWMQAPQLIWYGMIGVGVVAGILCWPLARVLVGLIGGGAGALAGHFLYAWVVNEFMNNAGMMDYRWAGAAAGAVIAGVLFMFLFRIFLILMTTAQGSLMMVGGALKLLSHLEDLYVPIRNKLVDQPPLILLVIGGLSLMGLAIQLSFWVSDRRRRKEELQRRVQTQDSASFRPI